jgi:hypothetical protein
MASLVQDWPELAHFRGVGASSEDEDSGGEEPPRAALGAPPGCRQRVRRPRASPPAAAGASASASGGSWAGAEEAEEASTDDADAAVPRGGANVHGLHSLGSEAHRRECALCARDAADAQTATGQQVAGACARALREGARARARVPCTLLRDVSSVRADAAHAPPPPACARAAAARPGGAKRAYSPARDGAQDGDAQDAAGALAWPQRRRGPTQPSSPHALALFAPLMLAPPPVEPGAGVARFVTHALCVPAAAFGAAVWMPGLLRAASAEPLAPLSATFFPEETARVETLCRAERTRLARAATLLRAASAALAASDDGMAPAHRVGTRAPPLAEAGCHRMLLIAHAMSAAYATHLSAGAQAALGRPLSAPERAHVAGVRATLQAGEALLAPAQAALASLRIDAAGGAYLDAGAAVLDALAGSMEAMADSNAARVAAFGARGGAAQPLAPPPFFQHLHAASGWAGGSAAAAAAAVVPAA